MTTIDGWTVRKRRRNATVDAWELVWDATMGFLLGVIWTAACAGYR